MSFSSQIKQEISQLDFEREDCAIAAMSAFVQSSGSLQLNREGLRLCLSTDAYCAARWSVRTAKKILPVETEILVTQQKKLKKKQHVTILLAGNNVRPFLKKMKLLIEADQVPLLYKGIHPDLVQDDKCKRAYLRGTFLSCGSVNNPNNSYHLELVLHDKSLAVNLCSLMNEYDLHAKIVLRKGAFVIYLKESDKVTTFLTLIEAHSALLAFENVRALKEFRNDLNRQVNCETANIQKTVTAATRQIENICYIRDYQDFDSLPADLRETAQVRINHPDATLAEIGSMLSTPVGKSGVNHRLRKLDELAKRIRIEKGDT